MSHFSVNAVKPMVAYIIGVALLCGFAWSVGQNVVTLPYSFQGAYHKPIAFSVFGLAAILGGITLLKNFKRGEKPWAVPRSQVNILYLSFFFTTFCAVLLAK
jgi:hypothetical protein